MNMPPRFPCLICSRGVRGNSLAISCDVCAKWCHIRCGTGITRDEYLQMTRSGAFSWTCTSCVLNGDMVDAMVSVMDEVIMPDPDHDHLRDAGFESSISDTESAPDLCLIESVHGSFVVPDVHNESSLLDDIPEENSLHDIELTWTKVTSSTQRGRDHLTNSHGYSYTVSKMRPNATDWVCSVRRPVRCKARVKEQDGVFLIGGAEHSHKPSTGITDACTVKARIRTTAKSQPFTTATQIVQSAMRDVIDPDVPCQALSQPSALRRGCNRQRAKGRHKANHLDRSDGSIGFTTNNQSPLGLLQKPVD